MNRSPQRGMVIITIMTTTLRIAMMKTAAITTTGMTMIMGMLTMATIITGTTIITT